MRGKLFLNSKAPLLLRNIPAYAGKTASAAEGARAHKEHPRVCGENTGRIFPAVLLTGTSPRMRGKPHHFSEA